MKKIGLVLFSFGMLFSLCILGKVAFAENTDKIILIDAGHGGIDGGAVSKSGILEKDINLSISLLLKEKLAQKGYTVYMTRETDTGLYKEGQKIKEKKREDLANRVKMKKSTECDIFISIHQNMFTQEKYKGAQVWHTSSGTSSKELATIIQNLIKEKIDPNNTRVAKGAGTQFRILNNSNNAASVIVECGFLSNQEECKLLTTTEYQDKIAQTLADSIEKYFSEKSE